MDIDIAPRDPLDLDVPPGFDDVLEPTEPPSWEPVDLGPILDGTHEVVAPTLLPRDDGQCLLYPGLTHSFHGESESGKSLVLQLEAVRLLEAGERVLFLDFESDAVSVTSRLLEFGASPESVRQRFTYLRPELRHDANGREHRAWADVLRGRYALAILDGVTEAMSLYGTDDYRGVELSRWATALPRRIADRTGAAVVQVDHVVKNADNRGRYATGGQTKLAALTGAAYVVDVHRPLGRGLVGVVVLRVAKDRPGAVRAAAGAPRMSDRTQEVARVVVDSTGPRPSWRVEPFQDRDAPSTSWRPTALMEKLSQALEAATEPLKWGELDELVRGKAAHKRTALAELEAGGFVAVTSGPRRALLHSSVKAYRQSDDPSSDAYKPRDGLDSAGSTATPSQPLNVSPSPSQSYKGTGDGLTQHTLCPSGTESGRIRDGVTTDLLNLPEPAESARCRVCDCRLSPATVADGWDTCHEHAETDR